MDRRRTSILIAALILPAATTGCGADDGPQRPQVAYVTNGIASFWTIAAAGAEAGAEAFDVDCDVRMPASGSEDQKRILEDLLARGVDGIAISPCDAQNQAGLIDEACALTHVITHDSDAPLSQRLCYVGMDNYAAGRMCGALVREALPDGGTVMLFIGRLEQDNARLRRQGVIDEILGRSFDSSRHDPPDQPVSAAGYTVLDTRTDQFDRSRAKANAEDALALYPDLGCMVGLFAYNPPACLEALRGAGRVGKVKVVAFDEADETLQGILDGEVHGTVAQDPFRYGYESVRILAGLARGEEGVLPADGYLDIPATVVRADNVEAFRATLRELTGASR
ncbi:MAG: sugar-binding protein [Planctomycetota bacterium]|jgi:ribose transport system substrate-binding protein|nr:sugar-binding protein [Planctomycetota bacterium]MDP6763423.1 sugar-binding protein [Planctomycetota bacterium]MDP6989068.1 sugar-binding protein [Planctomycetota bacterium]